MTARFGLGTYRCRDIAAASVAAIAHGVDVIDTAPVYGGGRAQAELAPVLAAHPRVQVSTKVGFMTAEQAAAAHAAGVITAEQTHRRHSIDPEYIEYQIERNRHELGRPLMDVLFLHNPEQAATDRPRLTRALIAAFERCEQAVSQGRIRSYGVATWDGFGGAFTIEDLRRAARQATGGGGSHLAVIQMPVSLVRLAPVADALNGSGPLVDAAAAGLEVWASAPLSGGELARIVTPELAALIRADLTPVQAALSAVASTPGVARVLLSASSADHWAEAAGIMAVPDAALRKVCDVLGT